jgi:hypothetical protein
MSFKRADGEGLPGRIIPGFPSQKFTLGMSDGRHDRGEGGGI